MKRWILRSLLFLLLLTLFVLLRTPAQHVVAYASPAIAPTVITKPSGTLWQGQAERLIHPQITLQQLQWDYRFFASLINGPGAALQANTSDGNASLNVHIGWLDLFSGGNSASLSDINAILPLSDLPLPPVAKSVPVNGDVISKLDGLKIQQGWPVTADGQIAIGDITYKDSKLWQLGAIIADVESIDSGISATLSSQSEYIDLNGVVELLHNGNYSVTADLQVDSRLPVVLRTMLIAAGKTQPNGRVRISYSGQVARPQANTPSN